MSSSTTSISTIVIHQVKKSKTLIYLPAHQMFDKMHIYISEGMPVQVTPWSDQVRRITGTGRNRTATGYRSSDRRIYGLIIVHCRIAKMGWSMRWWAPPESRFQTIISHITMKLCCWVTAITTCRIPECRSIPHSFSFISLLTHIN